MILIKKFNILTISEVFLIPSCEILTNLAKLAISLPDSLGENTICTIK